jgi:hypothetical protein
LDASRLGESIMGVNSAQQGQDRMNALGKLVNDPTQGPLLAQKLNMPGGWEALKAAYLSNPQNVGKMIETATTPTPDMANLDQITRYGESISKLPGATQADVDSIRKAITAKVAGPVAEKMVSDQISFRNKYGHDPSWKDNLDGYNAYIAQQGARVEALNIRPLSEGKVTDLENKIDDIKNDPALPGLMKRLLPDQGILSLVGRTDAERALLQKIKQATSDEYVRGLADPGLGTRKTQQEMSYVGQSLGGVLNATNLNADDYKAGLERLKGRLYETHADIYGQSGSFKGLDKKYYGFINDAYRRGGALGEGVDDAPDRKPLDDEARQFIKDNPNASKTSIIQHLREFNYDTSELTK